MIQRVSLTSKRAEGGTLLFIPQNEMTRIDREDDGRRGRFVIYEDELYAGEMTYEWQDARTIIVTRSAMVMATPPRRGIGVF